MFELWSTKATLSRFRTSVGSKIGKQKSTTFSKIKKFKSDGLGLVTDSTMVLEKHLSYLKQERNWMQRINFLEKFFKNLKKSLKSRSSEFPWSIRFSGLTPIIYILGISSSVISGKISNLWWRHTWLIIYDVMLSWNYIS